jgi:DNA-directed RNA polymerase specialized sigma24 family protein
MPEPAKPRPTAPVVVATEHLLLAILTILVDERDGRIIDRPDQTRTDVLLASVGLDHHVIAEMLGKNPDAVRMAIARARNGSQDSAKSRKPTSTRKRSS